MSQISRQAEDARRRERGKREVRLERWSSNARAYLAADPPGILLDVGCGTGESTLPLVDRTRMAVGLDVRYGLVKVARDRCSERGVENASFVVADAEALPIKTSSVDAVVSRCTLHHTSMSASLAEIRRVCVPGGKVFMEDAVNAAAWERSLLGYVLHVTFQVARRAGRGKFGAAGKFMKRWASPSWARHMLVENKKLTGEAFADVCEETLPGARIEELRADRRNLRWTAPGGASAQNHSRVSD